MGTLAKILIGIIIVLVIGISIYVPITSSDLTKLNKEMVAKDTVISFLQSDNKQLNDRLALIQKLNDQYNSEVNSIGVDTQKLENQSQTFSLPVTLENNPVGTATSVNMQLNSIFDEMSNLGKPVIAETKNK